MNPRLATFPSLLAAMTVVACGRGDEPPVYVEGGSLAFEGGTTQCGANQNSCAGLCVDPSDPTACGPTCIACPAPAGNGVATCAAGQCGIQCNGATVLCGTTCADTASDNTNCGQCGRSCNGLACLGGLCKR